MTPQLLMSRRFALGAGFAALLAPAARAAVPPGGRLAFTVFRNGDKVGEHVMTFTEAGGLLTVATDVQIRVKLGPVPVFRYNHTAREQWRKDAFQKLTTSTNSNGKSEKVEAERVGGGVQIQGPGGRLNAPATAAPLTHWNRAALDQPLFNPQLGKLLKVRVSRAGRETVQLASGRAVPAEKWSIRGEADIDNWYDSQGVWSGLRGKLEDGSTMLYRRT